MLVKLINVSLARIICIWFLAFLKDMKATYSLSVVSFIWSKKGLYLTSILYITHLFQASFCLLKLLKWQEWEQIHKTFLHIKFSIKFSIGSQTTKSNILLCFIMLWYSVQVYFILLFNNHENFNFRYIFRTH